MDQCGIQHAVLAPPDEYAAVSNAEGNRRLAQIIKQHPERFTALAAVNPWYGAAGVDMLKNAFDAGLVGLYLHPGRQGFHLTESILHPLIECCAAYGKPVFAYTGTPVCAMPFQLAELARQYPTISFILGHFGYTDFAGYDVLPAAKQTANLFIDTSCAWSDIIHVAARELGASRLLFGSGYPRSQLAWEMQKVQMAGLDDAAMQKIMSDNAGKVWGIKL